jgi:tetratricopeptide (TPR) repeat protein
MDTLEEPPQSCDVRLVPNPDTTDPDALQLLGLLYARIGLTRRAEGYLLAALQSSVQSGDSLGEAVSSDFLGQIYVALGNKKNALDKLQQAERAYKAIGDDENVAEVQRRSRILQMP